MDTSVLSSRDRLTWLIRLSRWHEYSTTKVPLIFTPALYLMLKEPQPPLESYARFGCMVIFTTLYLAFGYMLNDYADREVDRKANKTNLLGNLPRPIAWLFLLLTLTLGVLVLLPFCHQLSVVWSAALAYAAAAAYSLRPMRLKERGFLGLLMSAVAQRVLPSLVLFAIYGHWSVDTAAFLALYAVIGLRWILIHQILDEANDRKADVRTFVSQRGYDKTRALMYQIVFPLEIGLGLAVIILIGLVSPEAMLLLGAYWGEMGLRLILHRQGKVAFSLTQFDDIPLAISYFLLWPVFLSVSLSLRNPLLIGILGTIIVWQWGNLQSEGSRFFRLIRLTGQRAP
jgi:4-hydroxybenzoate polyprenyltransferase